MSASRNGDYLGWTVSDKWLLGLVESHLLTGGKRNSYATTEYADLSYSRVFWELNFVSCTVQIPSSRSKLLVGVPFQWDVSVIFLWPGRKSCAPSCSSHRWRMSCVDSLVAGGWQGGDRVTAKDPGDEQHALASAQTHGAVVFLLIWIWFSFQLCQCDFYAVVKREDFQFFYLV